MPETEKPAHTPGPLDMRTERDIAVRMLLAGVPAEGGNVSRERSEQLVCHAFDGGWKLASEQNAAGRDLGISSCLD